MLIDANWGYNILHYRIGSCHILSVFEMLWSMKQTHRQVHVSRMTPDRRDPDLHPQSFLFQATPSYTWTVDALLTLGLQCSKMFKASRNISIPVSTANKQHIEIYRGTPSPVDKDIHEISGLLSFDNFRVSAPSKLEPGAGWTDGREWGGLARDGFVWYHSGTLNSNLFQSIIINSSG